jgi:hypothetical protein
MILPISLRLRTALLAGVSALTLASAAMADEAVVLVQLNDYSGPEAYFHLYLVNPEGKFDHTLWVSGPEKIWWPDSKRWFGYTSAAAENLDAITGASTPAGARALMRVEIDPALIDAGYKLRVETSVENAENVQEDAEVELTKANQRVKVPGTGYVRYIRYKL